ncbi:MAG: hypothetical protein JWN73_5171 [Betaproteobacteria bacterium]|nr:hypothetical protein [Betaproteobacteria bacterium]
MEAQASESPYAPPRAVVADAEPDFSSLERPPEVNRILTLVWTVFGIGVVAAVLRMILPDPQKMPLVWQLAMYAVIFLISWWLNSKLAAGRNWARILYLIGSGLSLLFVPLMIFGLMRLGTKAAAFDTVVGVVNNCIGLYAAYLLLTRPAREWYHAMKARA